MKKKTVVSASENSRSASKQVILQDENAGSRFLFLGMKALDELKILARLASSKARSGAE